MNPFSFTIKYGNSKSRARTGILKTSHGVIHTPNFIPVATRGALRGISLEEAKNVGAEVLMVNTYHMLINGLSAVKKSKGLHEFMNWNLPIMTDSGGFQVFSLGAAYDSEERLNKFTEAKLIKEFSAQIKTKKVLKSAVVDNKGVTFYSHLDGSRLRLDPKISIGIQESLGADLIVAFDDHESPLWDYEETKKSLSRNNIWASQSLKSQTRKDQLMYGVIHGGRFRDLREASAKFTDENFKAIAIGGSYSSKKFLYDVIDWTVPIVSDGKPRHLLGIGTVEDIIEAVDRGIDLFDCVIPTRLARHGTAMTVYSNINLLRSEFRNSIKPIDKNCGCFTCKNFSSSYVAHLLRHKELEGIHLLTLHNVFFIMNLMEEIREAISCGKFTNFKKKCLNN